MKYRKAIWQKSFRATPDSISAKVRAIGKKTLRVEAVCKISISKITAGEYSHIGLILSGGKIAFPESFLPEKSNGHASNYNQVTKVIVLRDQPKVNKTYSWESPNFGDWTKGSHDVEITKLVYQKLFLEPLFLVISIKQIDQDSNTATFRFSIDRNLDPTDPNFEIELLRDLNLLQENVGASDVFVTDTSDQSLLDQLQLTWEILPVGTRDEVLKRYFGGRSFTPSEKADVANRYDVIMSLQPTAFISGTSGMQRYFGAKFSDKLVAFENLRYGNAIYIMQDNWQQLSKLDRVKLMKVHTGEIIRIVHKSGWEKQFVYHIGRLK